MCLEHWIKDEFSSSVPLHPKKNQTLDLNLDTCVQIQTQGLILSGTE